MTELQLKQTPKPSAQALNVYQVQLLMKSMASEISERCYAAGWMEGAEFILWEASKDCKSVQWGIDEITAAEALVLKVLADSIGMWFDDRSNSETEYPCGEYFMPLDEWRKRYEERKQ